MTKTPRSIMGVHRNGGRCHSILGVHRPGGRRHSILLFAAVAVIMAVNSYADKVKGPLPLGLDNLADAKQIELRNADGQVVMSGTFATSSEKKSEIERTAVLTGSSLDPDAKGEAEIELETKNGAISNQELEIEVEHLAPASTLRLFVDGREITTFTTNRRGKAELEFSSKSTK